MNSDWESDPGENKWAYAVNNDDDVSDISDREEEKVKELTVRISADAIKNLESLEPATQRQVISQIAQTSPVMKKPLASDDEAEKVIFEMAPAKKTLPSKLVYHSQVLSFEVFNHLSLSF